MNILLALLQRLFALHNGIYRLTGLERTLPRQSPAVSPEEASYGGEWGYLVSQGQRLFYRRWLPSGEPRAVLLAVHGAAGHGGQFRIIGEYLAPRGSATYVVDLPGHGRSEGSAAHSTTPSTS